TNRWHYGPVRAETPERTERCVHARFNVLSVAIHASPRARLLDGRRRSGRAEPRQPGLLARGDSPKRRSAAEGRAAPPLPGGHGWRQEQRSEPHAAIVNGRRLWGQKQTKDTLRTPIRAAPDAALVEAPIPHTPLLQPSRGAFREHPAHRVFGALRDLRAA